MVLAGAPGRRRGLLRCAALCFGAWAFGFLALPALSSAVVYPNPPTVPYTQPTVGGETPGCGLVSVPAVSEKENQTGHSVEVLTNEGIGECQTLFTVTKKVQERLFWVVDEILVLQEKVAAQTLKLEQLHKDLGAEGTLHSDLSTLGADLTKSGGLSVAVASLPELTSGTKAIGKVEVSNPTSYTGLESSVSEGTETANQNAWAIFGMIVGFGLLMLLWRLLRP